MTEKDEFCGGRFLLADATPQQVFTPEDLSPEQRQIVEMTRRFAAESVAPVIDRIERKDFDLLRQLIRQAGVLGLFAVDVPEQYGGLQMNKITSALITEWTSVSASLCVTFIAHSGIGLLPLLWYGTPEQKQRYLPGLISGETIAAYALSEGSSGSDALNIRATAVRSEDGSQFVLNGEKMWISNAGLASLFTIFAKIDGKLFSAFLVEAGTPGLSIGKEESKMGIRGSSTCSVVLRDCVVPATSLLGEAGKGHYIAFNVLNVGRYKLGAMALGGARYALQKGIEYGKQRSAFGKSITEFGLVQEKIAESAAMIYVAEALVYRTVGSIDASLQDVKPGGAQYAVEVQSRIAKFAVECSIAKVWCSEMQAVVVDHVLQIHGGSGFTEDYPAARFYRDARVNRIFEGTNEVNRLIISGWTEREIRGALAALEDDSTTEHSKDGVVRLVGEMKRAVRRILSLALTNCGKGYAEIQELAGTLADMICEVYALESSLLRCRKNPSALGADLVAYYACIARRRFLSAAEKMLSHIAPDEDPGDVDRILSTMRWTPADQIATGRRIAEQMLTD